MVKRFFGITDNRYKFEIWDVTALITILNVVFILLGFWWAPILGLTNCLICVIMNTRINAHINNYLTQGALVILNLYFLGVL